MAAAHGLDDGRGEPGVQRQGGGELRDARGGRDGQRVGQSRALHLLLAAPLGSPVLEPHLRQNGTTPETETKKK